MSSIHRVRTGPGRSTPTGTRPTTTSRRGGYHAAIDAAEERGKRRTEDIWHGIAEGLTKYASKRYWDGYTHGIEDSRRADGDGEPAVMSTEENADDTILAELDWDLEDGAL